MARARGIRPAEARGRRDGFDGDAPRDTDPEYLTGHEAGVQDRLAARERIAAATVRMRVLAGFGPPLRPAA
jgi:hypothetical protein